MNLCVFSMYFSTLRSVLQYITLCTRVHHAVNYSSLRCELEFTAEMINVYWKPLLIRCVVHFFVTVEFQFLRDTDTT